MLKRNQAVSGSEIRSSRMTRFAGSILAIAIPLALIAPASAQAPGGAATGGFGLNVKTFGAVGDCRHDDTAALQSAVNQINGRTLFIPAGCYLISQPIKVPFATGFRILGEGHDGTKIQQQTDNTPIIVFTKELTHSWEISDLEFGWSKNQGKENTNSVAILFSTDTATAGGLFDFTNSHITFDNGFRGIYLAPANHFTTAAEAAELNAKVTACYQAAYGHEPFVRLLEGKALPDTKNVNGTNVIEIAWRIDARTGRLIVMSAEDNLVKGASGQAVQSMNIVCGFPETAGLI